MDRVHFLTEGENGDMELCQPGYKDAATARKHVGELDVGTYHLVSFIETGISVEPPPVPDGNVVKRGSLLVTRKRAKAEDA